MWTNTILATESIPEVATEPTKHSKSNLKFQREFMNEIMADEKDTYNKTILNYFKYQNPLFLVKDLICAKQDKN